MIRNNALDNTKILMIFCVVFGHLIEPSINQTPIIKTIYLSIYSFHMPVFVLISGMLTKCPNTKNDIIKIVTTIIIPLFTFTLLYELFEFLVKGNISHYTRHFQPYWILWFLYSLFLWKIFLPIALKIRYPIILSIIISILAGYVDHVGYFLGISRTLYFFPFFLIGHIVASSYNKTFHLYKFPKTILIGILLLNPIIFWFFREMPHQWLYGSFSYNRLDSQGIFPALIRVCLYGISAMSAFAIIKLMTNKKLYITGKGKNTLVIYIWHGFFIKVFSGIGLISLINQQPSYSELSILLLLALILTSFLSANFISQNTYRFIFNPIKALIP